MPLACRESYRIRTAAASPYRDIRANMERTSMQTDLATMAEGPCSRAGRGITARHPVHASRLWNPAAISAQATTVLPNPGGATNTPRSWPPRSATASRWTLVNVPVRVNSCPVPAARSSVIRRQLSASPARAVTVPSKPRGRISPPSMVSSKPYRNRAHSRWRLASAAARRRPGWGWMPRAAGSRPGSASAPPAPAGSRRQAGHR